MLSGLSIYSGVQNKTSFPNLGVFPSYHVSIFWFAYFTFFSLEYYQIQKMEKYCSRKFQRFACTHKLTNMNSSTARHREVLL